MARRPTPATVVFGQRRGLILAATLLWAVKVVYVKRLLVAIPGPHGPFDGRPHGDRRNGAPARLARPSRPPGGQSSSAYGGRAVALGAAHRGSCWPPTSRTWYAALARAQAVDVTAVLVFGAVITALLAGAADGTHIDVPGIGLVVAGSALIAFAATRRGGAGQPA